MRFFAPELLSAASKTKETDMWALSCLILQIMTGEVPYNDAIIIAAVVSKILRGDPPYSVELVESLFSRSESFSGCLNKCWDMDPSLRPSARSLLDLIETPFFCRHESG
ncbi:hypothetical protein FRC03_010524 [Tulasnella sp. 419]|nr:hypothetical protein FRC03_010524 [Tulasnella sp. 419]